MVKKSTKLFIANKCGVWWVNIFHIYGGSNNLTGKLSNFVKVSVRKHDPNSKITKKTKLKSLLIRLKKPFIRVDGTTIRFFSNSGLLLKKRTNFYGSEIVGPTLIELKKKKVLAGFRGII